MAVTEGAEVSVIDALILDLMIREGGFVDDPDDDGGPTKYGITLDTLGEARNIAADRDDVFNLSRQEAHVIYKERYFFGIGLDLIDDEEVHAVVFDAAVLHGRRRAVLMLQKCVAAKMDGKLGPLTAAAINSITDPRWTVNLFSVERLKLVAGFVVARPAKLKYLKGWTRRITKYIE